MEYGVRRVRALPHQGTKGGVHRQGVARPRECPHQESVPIENLGFSRSRCDSVHFHVVTELLLSPGEPMSVGDDPIGVVRVEASPDDVSNTHLLSMVAGLRSAGAAG